MPCLRDRNLYELILLDVAAACREKPSRAGSTSCELELTPATGSLPTSWPAMLDVGLPRLRFHDLGHSSASLLLHMGIPPLEVARILGHSSAVTTTTIYDHAIAQHTSLRAAQVMDDALGGSGQQVIQGAAVWHTTPSPQ
jgi:hypothetical protein